MRDNAQESARPETRSWNNFNQARFVEEIENRKRRAEIEEKERQLKERENRLKEREEGIAKRENSK